MSTATDQFVEIYNPQKPLHTNQFRYGLRRDLKAKALKDRYVETTARNYRNLLVLDVDHEQADWHIKTLIYDEGRLPEPNWWVINPHSGHAHATYALASPVGTPRGWDYFEDVRWGLTQIAGADQAFNNIVTRNPLHSDHTVVDGTDHLYELDELKTFIPEDTKKRTTGVPAEFHGRNEMVFHLVRTWAYKNRYRYTNQEEWFQAVEQHTLQQGQAVEEGSDPLTINELKGIARSISKWTWQKLNPEGFSEKQRQRGLRNGEKERHDARLNDLATIIPLLEAGFSIREIAEHENISYNTAKQRVRRAKERQAILAS